MSFQKPTTENNEQRQHLNLSLYAYDIIENDRITFGGKSVSGFINQIFENFRDTAQASVSIALQHQQDAWSQTLSTLDPDAREKAIDSLTDAYLSSWKQNSLSFSKGQMLRFRINQRNYEYLTESISCSEDLYYGKKGIGKYLKALLEEYACKRFLDREAIVFRPYFEKIHVAIQERKRLKLQLSERTQFFVYPVLITTDPLSMYHYLIGYAGSDRNPNDSYHSASFRISNLQAVEIQNSGPLLKQKYRELVLQELQEKGAQFLRSPAEDIRVQLTPAGVKKYQRILHLRPQYVKKEQDVYVFHCTQAQIEFYFFKFGADARILEPKALADRFEKMYLDALCTYQFAKAEKDVLSADSNV